MNKPSSHPTLSVSAGIALSRISGLGREVALAHWFGASTVVADAFAAALGIPKILQNLLGEGALSASFIPVYAKLVDGDPQRARSLAGAVFGLLAAALAVVVLILMLFPSVIVRAIAVGLSADRVELTSDLVRVMAPGIGYIVLAAWCLGILNSHRDFFLSYVVPVLWNATIVLALIIAARRSTDLVYIAQAGAWGVLIGGFLQVLVQLPRTLRLAGGISPNLDFGDRASQTVLHRFIPGVLGRGVITLSTYVELALCSFLAVGAFSVLVKAQMVFALPISIFAVSAAAATLPDMSRQTADTSRLDGSALQNSVDRVIFFLTFSTVVSIAAGRHIVASLFERGRFSADDTVAVWLTLAAFAVGFVGSGLARLFQSAAFASGDAVSPAKIAAVRLLLATVVGVALMNVADSFAVLDQAVVRVDDYKLGSRASPDHVHLGSVALAIGGAVAAWSEFVLLRRLVKDLAPTVVILHPIARLVPAVVSSGVVAGVLASATSDLPAVLGAIAVLTPTALVYLALAAAAQDPTATWIMGRTQTILRRPAASKARVGSRPGSDPHRSPEDQNPDRKT